MLPAIKSSKLFLGLSSRELIVVCGCFSIRKFIEGATIFSAGDPADSLYLLNRGLVKIVHYSEGGEEMILSILKPSDFFGELIIGCDSRLFSAIAASDCEVSVISVEKLQKILSEVPRVSANFIEIISRKLMKIKLEFVHFGHKWSCQRLAMVLMGLCEEHGVETPEGIEIPFHVTHEELANMIGASRVTVTVQIKRLKEEGVLKQKNRKLLISTSRLQDFIAP